MPLYPNSKRSFPEAREFLLNKIVGRDYPVKHLIEQARNKGHITKGKRGRGGGVVTSRDMAVLLAGTLAGDTPQVATDAMAHLTQLMPNTDALETDHLKVDRLADDWWNHSFIDVIALIIETWRNDFQLGFDEINLAVIREPAMYARLSWNNIPYERDVFVTYSTPSAPNKFRGATPLRHLSASYNGEVLRRAADWLERQEGHR